MDEDNTEKVLKHPKRAAWVASFVVVFFALSVVTAVLGSYYWTTHSAERYRQLVQSVQLQSAENNCAGLKKLAELNFGNPAVSAELGELYNNQIVTVGGTLHLCSELKGSLNG